MSEIVTIALPGTSDTSWTYLPARSTCCKLESTQVISHVLCLSNSFEYYDPGTGPGTELAAMIALYEDTDPAGLGDPAVNGAWYITYNTDTHAAEIVEGSSAYGAAIHLLVETPHSEGDSFLMKLARSKVAFKVGWLASVLGVPWREMDGTSLKVEYATTAQAIDDGATPTGDISTTPASETFTMADGDTEKWSDFIAIPEPGGQEIHCNNGGDAYADRDCLGD